MAERTPETDVDRADRFEKAYVRLERKADVLIVERDEYRVKATLAEEKRKLEVRRADVVRKELEVAHLHSDDAQSWKRESLKQCRLAAKAEIALETAEAGLKKSEALLVEAQALLGDLPGREQLLAKALERVKKLEGEAAALCAAIAVLSDGDANVARALKVLSRSGVQEGRQEEKKPDLPQDSDEAPGEQEEGQKHPPRLKGDPREISIASIARTCPSLGSIHSRWQRLVEGGFENLGLLSDSHETTLTAIYGIGFGVLHDVRDVLRYYGLPLPVRHPELPHVRASSLGPKRIRPAGTPRRTCGKPGGTE